jgi:copper chaperone
MKIRKGTHRRAHAAPAFGADRPRVAARIAQVSAQRATVTVTVSGMTCGHCVSSVREEISTIAGVTGVDIDLSTGAVTIDSESPVAPAELKVAVEEAGYQLAS